MVRENPDPYLVLGVSPSATQDEITHAYRTRIRANHPDTRETASSQSADEHLRQVLTAYALLRDPSRRADYDRAVKSRPDRSPAGSTPVDGPRDGGVQIPVTHRRSRAPTSRDATPPLRAGPVRRHR